MRERNELKQERKIIKALEEGKGQVDACDEEVLRVGRGEARGD